MCRAVGFMLVTCHIAPAIIVTCHVMSRHIVKGHAMSFPSVTGAWHIMIAGARASGPRSHLRVSIAGLTSAGGNQMFQLTAGNSWIDDLPAYDEVSSTSSGLPHSSESAPAAELERTMIMIVESTMTAW